MPHSRYGLQEPAVTRPMPTPISSLHPSRPRPRRALEPHQQRRRGARADEHRPRPNGHASHRGGDPHAAPACTGCAARPARYDLADGAAYCIYNRRMMPVSLATSTREQGYWALRRDVVRLDTGELPTEIAGPDAGALLDRIFTRRVSALKPGRCTYGIACWPDGGILVDAMRVHACRRRARAHDRPARDRARANQPTRPRHRSRRDRDPREALRLSGASSTGYARPVPASPPGTISPPPPPRRSPQPAPARRLISPGPSPLNSRGGSAIAWTDRDEVLAGDDLVQR